MKMIDVNFKKYEVLMSSDKNQMLQSFLSKLSGKQYSGLEVHYNTDVILPINRCNIYIKPTPVPSNM